MTTLLEVRDLHVQFPTEEGVVKAVNGASLTLEEGQVLGVVGETGAGKTMTALAILRLLPFPGRIVQGEVRFAGRRLADLSEEQMQGLRGQEIAIVFQDASSALNPILTIGTQMMEAFRAHANVSAEAARDRSAAMLEEMGLPDPYHLLERFPFQLSGGMAQRVMIAMALSLRPRLLIADEPTSNLDVTLQAEILHRLRRLQKEQGASIMLITHDLGVIAQMADQVAVMYAGEVMEVASARALFRHPAHPYTWALLQALPRMDYAERTLRVIPGAPPDLVDLPDQCPFIPRCPKATVECRTSPRPPLTEVEDGHWLACYNPVLE